MTNPIYKRKNLIFLIYYSVIIILMTFPGPFDWANRIQPWIVGLPFSIFYLLSLTLLLIVGTIVQYKIEDRLGELDIEVEQIDEDANSSHIHESNTKSKVGGV